MNETVPNPPSELGRLTPVPLRHIWPHEAQNFTPWLAGNLDALSDALALGELELIGTEHRVGPFAIDVLARTSEGEQVVIENQLERSDHGHLGQLVTYAAGVGATMIVWVLPELQDEHRSALDWLNEHTDEHVNFFGVVVEAMRIGDSLPAPVFRVEARPNDWQKRVRASSSGSHWDGWERGYQALSAVPAGRWTSLHELAEVVGTTPAWMGRHMYDKHDLPNFHRMLGNDGAPWRYYRTPDGAKATGADAILKLEGEGLTFDQSGRADPSRRLSAPDLRALIE